MGKYVNKDLKFKMLGANGKAQALIESGAEEITEPATLEDHPGKAVLCVVENGPFDAAAWAHSNGELSYFKEPDPRPKTWLTVDSERIEYLID